MSSLVSSWSVAWLAPFTVIASIIASVAWQIAVAWVSGSVLLKTTSVLHYSLSLSYNNDNNNNNNNNMMIIIIIISSSNSSSSSSSSSSTIIINDNNNNNNNFDIADSDPGSRVRARFSGRGTAYMSTYYILIVYTKYYTI